MARYWCTLQAAKTFFSFPGYGRMVLSVFQIRLCKWFWSDFRKPCTCVQLGANVWYCRQISNCILQKWFIIRLFTICIYNLQLYTLLLHILGLFLSIYGNAIFSKKEICLYGRKRTRQFRELGLTISYYRKLKGLTQTQLAESVGLSRTHISNIEAPR